MKMNRIRLHKMNRNLVWKEIVQATGINKTRLLHLANNQGRSIGTVEGLRLADFFKCQAVDFFHYMEVEIEL